MDTYNQASTYAQITHCNINEINKTTPKQIGVRVIPFPSQINKPQSSTVSDNYIPRCLSCGAFYNKFNVINGGNFVCSLCGKETKLSYAIDEISIHQNSEVYEVFSMDKYSVRQEFVPTEFFVVSLSILKRLPGIIDLIIERFQNDYQSKQIGFAILDNNISIVKFRNSFSLQTYVEEVDILRCSQYFAAVGGFCHYLKIIKNMLPTMKYKGSTSFSSKCFINFIKQLSISYGTSVHMILDENVFHIMSNETSIRDISLTIARFCGQVSISLFINDFYYRNPLLELPIITGGYLRFFKPDITFEEFQPIFQDILKRYLYHDTFIFMRLPDNINIDDFAGKGLLKTNRSIMVPKIEVGDSFSFSFDSSKIIHPFFQFVIFYTSQLNVRKLRIITFPIFSKVPYNYPIISLYTSAMIAQRFLIEGLQSSKVLLEQYKKQFSNCNINEFKDSEFLINCNSFLLQYEKALLMRDGCKKINFNH